MKRIIVRCRRKKKLSLDCCLFSLLFHKWMTPSFNDRLHLVPTYQHLLNSTQHTKNYRQTRRLVTNGNDFKRRRQLIERHQTTTKQQKQKVILYSLFCRFFIGLFFPMIDPPFPFVCFQFLSWTDSILACSHGSRFHGARYNIYIQTSPRKKKIKKKRMSNNNTKWNRRIS